MGLRIFLHSVRLVFNQWRDALRISGLLYLLSAAISTFCLYAFPPIVIEGQSTGVSWQFFASLPFAGLVYLWIAVGWHRFVLLDELPGAVLPIFHGGRILAYFGRGVQAALVVMGVGLVFSFVNIALAGLSNGSPIVAGVGFVVVTAIILLASYRLAPMFPGAAIGQSVGVGAAWTATRGAWIAIVVLAVVSTIASIVVDLPAELLKILPAGLALATVWLTITSWIKLMVGISVLTTIYGVYVEKRPIAD